MASDKTMSSRLLTMKFMQRAAASPSSASSTPDSRPHKRPRYADESYYSSPSTPSKDQLAIQAALAEEELKRSHAVEKQAAEAGETRWELSMRDAVIPKTSEFKIIHTGYAELDAGGGDDSEEMEPDQPDDAPFGRRVAGRMVFGKKMESAKRKASDSASDSSSDEAADVTDVDADDLHSADALIRQAQKEAGRRAREDRSAKKRAAETESKRLAEKRRKKEINLSRIDSISGGGAGGGSRGSPHTSNMKCFTCGGRGHKKADCPKQA